MNKIRRHVPGYIDLDHEPEVVEFNTTEELLNIDFVNGGATTPTLQTDGDSKGWARVVCGWIC